MLGGNDTLTFGLGGTATVSQTSRAVWAIVSCREVTGTTNPIRRGGAKSFVDDLGWSRGVVLSRAATLLRSIETQPYDSKICSLSTSISLGTLGRCSYYIQFFNDSKICFHSDNAFPHKVYTTVDVLCPQTYVSSILTAGNNDIHAGAKWADQPVGPASGWQ